MGEDFGLRVRKETTQMEFSFGDPGISGMSIAP